MTREKRFSRKTMLVLMFLAGLLTVSSAVWAYSAGYLTAGWRQFIKAPKVSREMAKNKAEHILAKLGSGPGTKKFISKERVSDTRLLWKINAIKDGEVWIDANDGEVKFVTSSKGLNNASAYAKSSLPVISKEVALGNARKIAKDLQVYLPDKEPAEAKLLSHSNGDDRVQEWFFSWPREKQVYSYLYDFTLIGVDAYKGELIGYHYNHSSDEPQSLDIKIDKAKALELAAVIADVKGFMLVPDKAELMIIKPNYCWSENFVGSTIESRLAWVIHFKKMEATGEGIGEIWIDVTTGEVLGGMETA